MTSQEFRAVEEALREIGEVVRSDAIDDDGYVGRLAYDFAETYGHTLLEIARDHLKF